MKVTEYSEIGTRFEFKAELFQAASKAGLLNINMEESGSLDLNILLAPNPEKFFLVRVNGESMIDEGIFDGDILVVERSEVPIDGEIIISALNGELTVKTFRLIDGTGYLYSANKKFLPIEIMTFYDFSVQGIVRHIIHYFI
ncbi:MAG: S24 family peptidase [Candidatus Kapabacteria bacterium]|nr:S24 family peptidase [Candidatus Kapabacteria bacterium]